MVSTTCSLNRLNKPSYYTSGASPRNGYDFLDPQPSSRSCGYPPSQTQENYKKDPCCNPYEYAFQQDAEFKVRLQPPSPYPPKDQPGGRRRVGDKGEVLVVESDFICREIPGPQWSSRFCLQRIHTVLIRPELEHMGERVLSLWSIYLQKSPSGLLIGDSDIMANIGLQLGIKFPQLVYSYEFMELFTLHLKKGVRIKRSGDALEIKRLAYALTVFGQTITQGFPHAQQKMLEILIHWMNLATSKDKDKCLGKVRKCPDGKSDATVTKLIPGEIFISSMELSRLPRLLGDYIVNGSYTAGYCDLLDLLRKCCDLSPIVRARTLKMPLLDPLLLKLCLEDCSNKILGRTIELIYSYLGNPVDQAHKQRATPCPQDGMFEILLDRFFKQITQFTSKMHLNLRNDTAFLICLLARNIPPLRKRFGKYAAAVASLVSSNIMGTQCIQIPYIIDSTREDSDLLKCLIWMLKLIVKSGDCKQLINEYQLVPVLMRVFIGPSRLIEEIDKISPTEDLDAVAWYTMTCIAKQEPKTFLQKDGVPTMMAFLRIYIADGNTDIKTLSMFTHLLRTILTSHEENTLSSEVMSYFHKLGALDIFIEAMRHLTATNFSNAEEAILCNLLLCCSALGQYDISERDAFTGSNGVKVLTRLIRQVLYHPAHERHMEPTLHIAIAECVLRCIADSPTCLEAFLGYEGLLRLLDLLELSAGPPASLHILNCILELCEYPRCMDQLLYWRRPMRNLTQRLAHGDGFNLPNDVITGALRPAMGEALGEGCGEYDHTLSALFCELWRDEENRLGVLRDADGCIASIEKPLMSEFARGYKRPGKKIRLPSSYPGPSCLDMTGSVRPKIFLLAKKITETTNTEAQLFDSLSLKNQITIQIIINFLDLKRGELWLELMEELQEETKFKLVFTDERAMNLLVRISKNKVAAVIETQRYLISRSMEKDEIHERELYKIIKKCHLQDHLKAIREAEYMAKTTNYNYLVEKRLWQKTQFEKAIVKNNPNMRIHRTTDGPLNITVWPGRNKIFESEPAFEGEVIAETEPEDYIPLSASETEDISIRSSFALGSVSNENLYKRKSEQQRELYVSLVTALDGATPKSEEGGFYQVNPSMLRKALQQVLAEQKKLGWISNVDEENHWKVRAKWRQDWYPEERMTVISFKSESSWV